MSNEDYEKIAHDLFVHDGEEEQTREYLNFITSSYQIPTGTEEKEEVKIEDLEDDEEEAYEMLSPAKIEVQRKVNKMEGITVSYQGVAETKDMYKTRTTILKKLYADKTAIPFESLEMVSFIINNKLWYNCKYDSTTEMFIERILSNL